MADTPVDTRRDALLWMGILGGPLAWAVNLQAGLIGARLLCGQGRSWPLVIIGVAMAATSFGAATLGWRNLRRSPTLSEAKSDRVASRVRIMSMAALGTGLFFAVLICASTFPAFVLHPCEVP